MPYGILAADQITSSVTGSSIGPGNATRFKNRIINGDMRIDQRNAGASTTQNTAFTYNLDRWFSYGSVTSKFTIQQNAGSVTPPVGFINYLGVTSSSAYSVSSSDIFFIAQKIEGLNMADLAWGTANAKTVTLSFQVYSSLTGTFGGAILNSATNRSYPFSYTISSANTWTQISLTIAGDTTGTWLTTNGIGMYVAFGMGVGSTNSGTAGSWAGTQYYSATGATSVVGTNGATFYITGVQLEVGSIATGFEYRDYGTELVMCQRYFEKSYNMSNAQGTATSADVYVENISSAAYPRWVIQFQVRKRTAPSIRYWDVSGTENQWNYWNNGSAGTSSWSNQTITEMSISTELNNGTTFSVRANAYGHWTASAEL